MADLGELGFEVLTEGDIIRVTFPESCADMRQLTAALCANKIEPSDSEMARRLRDGIPALGHIAGEGVASEAQK